MRIRGNYSFEGVLKQVQSICKAAEDMKALSDGQGLRQKYLDWVTASEEQLRRYLADSSWADDFITSRYIFIQQDRSGLGKDWSSFTLAVRAEIDTQHQRLVRLMSLMQMLNEHARRSGAPIVLDTNAYLHVSPFEEVDWCKELHQKSVRIVLPIEILRELDKVKYMRGDRSARADNVLKVLDGLSEIFEQGVAMVRENVTIEVCAINDGHTLSENVDEEIISRSVLIQQASVKPVTVITDDRSMRVRARVAGLQAWPIPDHLLLRKRRARTE